ADELRSLLGRGRSRRGIFEGDLVEGELEIGQVASLIDTVVPAEQVVEGMMKEYYEAVEKLNRIVF
ncbi:MAG TPA: nitronate monooxygenase, partial [Porphyromonadaceae bacterium]|nr:nitronate monooxygenase [Porphyromonadaceae bacterium]